MSIVTKTGDKGTTSLFGGERVSKGNARLHAYGTVDELNAVLGAVLSDEHLIASLRPQIVRLQHLLFRAGADLSTPLSSKAKTKRMEEAHVKELEEWITALEQKQPVPTSFILPGGHRISSQLHIARTVCRRAERWVVTLGEKEEINKQCLIFLNRLSDYLFLAAKEMNAETGIAETDVEYGE